MAAAQECLRASDQTTKACIRSWKNARLSAGAGGLDYPKVSILVVALMGRGPRGGVLPEMTSEQERDAEIVQKLVDIMPARQCEAFEARHLMIIKGKRSRWLKHALRARSLGVSERTYWNHVRSAYDFIANRLLEYI